MNTNNTLVALWAGQLKEATEVVSNLAIHPIDPTAKIVMQSCLTSIGSLADAIKEQLKKQVTE